MADLKKLFGKNSQECSMTLNLTADRVIQNRIYPALAAHEARPYTQSWREFGQHWPYTIPVRFQEYFDNHGVQLKINQSVSELQFYPIGLAFFDFSIDYIGLIPLHIKEQIRLGSVKILFYYHEGDNPERIKHRVDSLNDLHSLPTKSYVFVSANSSADRLDNFVYFNDFELWYYQRNESVAATPIHSDPRHYDFTALCRLHKSWRATIMTDLFRNQILDYSQWSYCETGVLDDDNPIEIDSFDNLRNNTELFLKRAPFLWDQLNQDQRNDHSLIGDIEFYKNSYCNIVVETHFDADQSAGVFLTEKTFKPIKHGQLFFIAGCAGSLRELRDLGYRTFDNVLDTGYDQIENNSERWRLLLRSIKHAQRDLHKIYQSAIKDIEHNQQLFLERKTQRLNNLVDKIYEKSN
jgi:hypothetical protein